MTQSAQIPRSPVRPETAREELERLCASDALRHSKQAIRLLRYLVDNSIEGHEEALRERAIGSHIFGRDPKYDTNEDSIVRVGAADLRKRLTRAYHESAGKPPVQFHIPVGSYRVEFQVAEPEVPPAPAPAPRRARWPWIMGALAVPLALGLWLLWPAPTLDLFWGPALRDSGAVVVLAPHPIVYTFSRDTFRRFRGDDSSHAQRQIEPFAGPPDATIALREVIPLRGQYMGIGSAHAIADLAALFATRKKHYTIRIGGEFSFQDIREGPAVLIGAYANRWTLQLTDDSRFVLSEKNGVPEILDRTTQKSWTVPRLLPDGRTPDDYVIVSRLFHPKTGRLLIALAGITQYGTQSAGEFVTSAELLESALRGVPSGWERKNLQVVLHVPIVEGIPGRPEVVATHVW